MARTNNAKESDDEVDIYSDPYRDSGVDLQQDFSSPRANNESGESREPTPSSDLENTSARSRRRVRFRESDLKLSSLKALSKRSETQHNQALRDRGEDDTYDPDQNPKERQEIRKTYRDQHRYVTDNKSDYIKNTDKIIEVFNDANETFTRVKQTADATLDSRLLVTAADLAVKRAAQMATGVKGSSIEVDDFIGKAMRFLQNSPEHVQMGGQFDWAYLGRMVTSRCCKRPPTKDFLNGPLAVVKKVRVVKQRKQRKARNMADMVKPQELRVEDIAKNENSTTKNTAAVLRIIEEYMGENELEQLLYFKFVVNPESFGQTVENMFYTAFLVRDGHLALHEIEGLPYLIPSEPPTAEEIRENNLVRQQVVFSMDKKTWRELIRVFNITESIIPTRPRETQAIGASGWYS